MADRGPSFCGWSVKHIQSVSYQNLFQGTPDNHLVPYQDRVVTESTVSITVYMRHGTPEVMGQSIVTIDPFSDPDAQVSEACDSALLISNPVWELPHPPSIPYPEVVTSDLSVSDDPEAARQTLLREIREAAAELKQVRLNSAESYINIHTHHTETSSGIVMHKNLTDLYFEAAMEKLPGPNTQEVHRYRKGVSLNEMKIRELFAEMQEETLSLDSSIMPKTSENAVILISESATADLLDAVVSQLDASAEYSKMPFMKEGDTVDDPSVKKDDDADALHLTLDPHLPAMALSTGFTQEGLPAMPAKLIEKNRVLHQMISFRMGQYLGRSPNGFTGNLVVKPGTASKQQLLESVPECIEILSFSSLLINSRSLTWSSEIKLGKLYRNGKPVAMIKGGVASGSIKENLSNARFTDKTVLFNNIGDSWHPSVGYQGPSHMLIRSGVKIAGE